MKIDLLISTINNGINKVKKNLLKHRKKAHCTIIHQITEDNINPDNNLNNYKNVNYHFYYENGLSRSRNRAINKSKGDICVIVDDDVRLKPKFNKIIKSAYHRNDADVITFQSENLEGDLRKKYPKKIKKHTWLSILSVSSIEISFKKDNILDKNIGFNEDFGLGTKYISGEENLFLKNCLDLNMNLIYYPRSIAKHHVTDHRLKWDEEYIISKSKLLDELFGWKSLIFKLYFLIMKHKYYKQNMNIIEFIRLI